MRIDTRTTGILSEAWAELQAALDRLSRGIRDPEAAGKSRARMDRLREENRKRLGVQNIAMNSDPRIPRQPMKYVIDSSVGLKWVGTIFVRFQFAPLPRLMYNTQDV